MVAAIPGWLTGSGGTAYPSEPWHLEGTMYVSMWRMRTAELPAICLPQGVRPARILGQALVGTAWAVYRPGGVLAYNEVLAAVRVHAGGHRFTTITHIWVDHPSSIAGARALWDIPKQPAVFQVGAGVEGADLEACAATVGGQPIAALRFRSRFALPGRWHLHTRIAQRPLDPGRAAELTITRARALTSIHFGAAMWDFAPDGPLGFFNGRKPCVSVRLAGISLRFGE